jgi:hypothetical protein
MTARSLAKISTPMYTLQARRVAVLQGSGERAH